MLIELKKTGLPNQVFYIINASLSTFHQTSSQHEGQPFFVERHISRKKIIMCKHNRCTNGVTNLM
jgi:hypothetical protein